jgi:glycosyltransferase involved in cell wall biosynthesis
MVVLEGMIHGLAVAASGIGGPAEILKNAETGLLFPPRNAEALAQAILRLVNDSELRLQIAAAGTKEVLDSWLWPQIVKKIVRVYEEVTVGSHE